MADDGNRTEKGVAPAPSPDVATAETVAPDDAPSPSASRSLPALDRERYKIVGEVGRGGLGRILRAEDRYLERPVAVKELLAPDDAAKARFVREALITARLQHPAIVPIYDAGDSAEKGPFYAMKLVAGASLADELRDKQTLEQRLELLPSMITVVEAMAYAHDENIIHRDLKPQNVLVGKYGETVLIDWGLAKDLSAAPQPADVPARDSSAASSSTETMDGAVMGTPAFMPPEQAAGEDADKRADVYALGAMLYYLICGAPPHGGRTMDEMLLKIVEGNVVPVQEREPRCPADLATIVGKAMATDPTDRYPTAKELAIDLKKFQTGQLVGAHEYTLGERARRWLKRHRGIVAVSTIALAVLIAYGIWSIQQIRTREAEAVAAAKLANANAEEANRQRAAVLAQAMLVRARRYAATGHTAEEVAVLRALATREPKLAIEEGGLIWKAHQRLAMALGTGVGLATRSADGARFIATEPGALVAWDAHTGKELSRMPIVDEPRAARFGRIFAISPTGRYAIIRECVPPAATCGVDIILDGNVFVPREDTELVLRDTTTSAVVAKWTDRLDRRTIAFSTDDAALAIQRGDKVTIYDGAATPRATVDVPSCTGQLAIATPQRFAIACRDHVALHTETGMTQILRGPAPTTLAFVSPERLLAIGDRVALWDVARGELRGEGKLQQDWAQRVEEAELDEMAWSYYAPGAPKPTAGNNEALEITVGHATSIVGRTSVLSPPPRLGTNGAVLSLEGHDWQAIAIHDDYIRYALVDQLVPPQPPDRCLSRVGGERHAMTALDNGERLLVDQQELALGLAAAPAEGYRHTTTAETPVRQLRPLVAAEADACLVWGSAVGAHRIDGGAIPPFAGAAARAGGLIVAGVREAFAIDRSGTRTPLAIGSGIPLIAPSAELVAVVDVHAKTVAIHDATGKLVRSWTAPRTTTASDTFDWIASGVLLAHGHVISTDPAIAPRVYAGELTTDPRSPAGAKVAGTDVVVQRVADGVELARHAIAADRVAIVPDDSGRVIVETGAARVLVAPDGKRLALQDLAGDVIAYESIPSPALLVAHQQTRSDVWDLATGKLLDIPASANLVAIVDDALWMLAGPRQTTLVRVRRDGAQRTERVLQTPGLPFDHIVDDVSISADRKRLSARYAVREDLFAQAIWDVESGALLWVGPPATSIAGEWLVAGGRAYVPVFDLPAVLRDSGARTNLRVCEADLRVVPVVPPPPADSVWAPAGACR